MRPIALLCLTLGTASILPSATLGCAQTSGLPAVEASAPPPAANPPAPALAPTPAPATATAQPPAPAQPIAAAPQPPAPAAQPIAAAPQPHVAPPDPVCVAGCDSANLAPELRASCHVQCKRLAQQQHAAAPVAPAQPDRARQHAACEAQCDAETSPGDRATCRLQCGHYLQAAPSPAAAPSGVAPPAQQQQQIAACQATCDREASATDRHTCRNNCGAVGTTVGPAPSSQYVLGPAPTTSDADQRAAVIRNSSGVVQTTIPAPPPPQQPPNPQCAAHAQSCALACASQQSACSAQCDQGKMSATDRATCKLNCGSTGELCRDDCRAKEAACKPVTY